jgi:lysophospholipase L1-like esterase
MKCIATLLLCVFLFVMAGSSRAEHEGKIQILLLGDSATESSIPRKVAPQEPQFEDVVRILLAAEGDLPPTNVINLGLSGEFIRRLLDSGRYDRAVARLPGPRPNKNRNSAQLQRRDAEDSFQPELR